MDHHINRRAFMKAGTALGLAALAPRDLLSAVLGQSDKKSPTPAKSDIAVVTGEDYYKSTEKAIELLGGIRKFVPNKSTVALLVNSRYEKPGTYVKPEIVLAVMKLCLEAGASAFYSIEGAPGAFWRRSPLSEKFTKEIREIKQGNDEFVNVEVHGGIALKKAQITRPLLECDVLINIPIVKDHEGLRATGTLKNMMGATSGSTNTFFHKGTNAKGYYDDIDHLSQCIADVNLVRKPALCIVDATEFILTNGPFGPGKIGKPRKVIASADRVAADSLATEVLGLKPEDIVMIRKAHKHGLGEMERGRMTIREANV